MKKDVFVLFIALAIIFGGIVLSGCESTKPIQLEQVDMQKFFVLTNVDVSTYIRRVGDQYHHYDRVYGNPSRVLPAGTYLIGIYLPTGSVRSKETIYITSGGYTKEVEHEGVGLTGWTWWMRSFDFEVGSWYKYSKNQSEIIIVQPTEDKDLYVDSNGFRYPRRQAGIFYREINSSSSQFKEVDQDHVNDGDKYLYFVRKIDIQKIEPIPNVKLVIDKSDLKKSKKR